MMVRGALHQALGGCWRQCNADAVLCLVGSQARIVDSILANTLLPYAWPSDLTQTTDSQIAL